MHYKNELPTTTSNHITGTIEKIYLPFTHVHVFSYF